MICTNRNTLVSITGVRLASHHDLRSLMYFPMLLSSAYFMLYALTVTFEVRRVVYKGSSLLHTLLKFTNYYFTISLARDLSLYFERPSHSTP
jgi:hypothetical protein